MVNSNPLPSPDVEQVAAEVLQVATTVAHTLADLAVTDDRYDQIGALSAAAYAIEAASYLPLPTSPRESFDQPNYREAAFLVRHLEEIADELDELARRSTELRQTRDRHTAALRTRDTATALRNALPVGEASE
ncbi:hypothetical protein VM95_11380 [Streptomyces rubellomurinus]|uniref:Uncharacterized protein n=2 Tax=Streptomyces rubellomurinus (strain ATCC 31215) TaxID=359131 RepID=A0A0F2TI72_STRR3|nr:hypothetical protein VM95_11380 [Streptomyces rubellomurinus]